MVRTSRVRTERRRSEHPLHPPITDIGRPAFARLGAHRGIYSITSCGLGKFHPPRAIAIPTSAAPTTTITRPVAQGRSPALRANITPQKNSDTTAMVLEIRNANCVFSNTRNGITTGKVERITRVQTPNAPSQSRRVNLGRVSEFGCAPKSFSDQFQLLWLKNRR